MATEYTPNYNLDLYASADKPNLRDQYNAAMGKIDTQMKKSADDVTNANANVLTLQTQMTEAQKDIAELESTVDDALSLAQTNESEIETTQGTVTSLTSRVVAVEGTANQNKTDIASIDTRVGVAEGNITEAQNDIDGLQTAVDGKAPTNHASTANTYGQGSSTNFGHLKVVDSGTASASTGTAASPQMVNAAIADMATVETATVDGSKINDSTAFSVTMNWNKALGIANFRFATGFTQTDTLNETRLTATPFPANMRPSSDRTLKSYGIATMYSPAGTFDATSTIAVDLVYKTDGHLYLASLETIGSTQWTSLSTAQGVLFTQGW